MAQQIIHREIGVEADVQPPGFGFDLGIPQGVADVIEVRIPDGHAGKTGIVIWYAGTQYVPNAESAYLTGNNETFVFDVDDVPTGQGWTYAAYNQDLYQHTFYLTFFVNPIPFSSDGILPPIIMLPFPGDDNDGIIRPGDIGFRPF